MSDADCLLDTLVQILRRYSPNADEAELKLRCHSDPETLEIIRERCLRWALDLRHRGTVCRFWEQISHALRDAGTKRVHYEELPESVWLQINEPAKGFFVRPREEADAILLAEMLAKVNGKTLHNPYGHAARIENPGRARIERRDIGE